MTKPLNPPQGSSLQRVVDTDSAYSAAHAPRVTTDDPAKLSKVPARTHSGAGVAEVIGTPLPKSVVQSRTDRRAIETEAPAATQTWLSVRAGHDIAPGIDGPENAALQLRARGEIESPAPATAFLRALGSLDYYVRDEAIDVLVRGAERQGWIEGLVDLIEDQRDSNPPYVRGCASIALARIARRGNERAIGACLDLIGSPHVDKEEISVALARAPEEIVLPRIERASRSENPRELAVAQRVLQLRQAMAVSAKSPPAMTFPYLPVANGTVAAVLDVQDGSIQHVRDTIFSNPSEDAVATDRIGRLVLQLVVDGQPIRPEDDEQVQDSGYVDGTPIAWRRATARGIESTQYLIAPGGDNIDAAKRDPRITVLLHIENTSNETKHVAICPTHRDATAAGERPPIKGKAGVELAPGQDSWFALELDMAGDLTIPSELEPDVAAPALLAAETERFAAWQRQGRHPDLPEHLAAVYRQMKVCMLMGQAPDGQIVASVPPGHWNVSWVRDMSYALVAMAECGELEQARRGLEFLIGTDHETRFEHFDFNGEEAGVGAPYQISVVRHFGDGREEADVADGSPNIEFDGFGLVLWALDSYIEHSGDLEFLREHWATIDEKIGDVILQLRESGNGLVRRDSGIWERHLPGRQFTYTSAACERGLRSLATLADKLEQPEAAKKYRAGARELRQAIRDHLVTDKGVVVGYAGDPVVERNLDASAIEVINWGVIDVDEPSGFDIALNTIAAFREHLGVPDSPGFMRTNNHGWYEEQEWVVLDLRVAEALYRLARSPEATRRGTAHELQQSADELVDWVTSHISANNGVVGELLGNGTRLYEGAVPMVGYGPGALIMALHAKAETVAALGGSPSQDR